MCYFSVYLWFFILLLCIMLFQLFLSDYKPLSLKPIFFGFEECSPGHLFSGFRNYFILHLIYEGYGTFYMQGKKWNIGPGEGFIIPPDTRNKYTASDKKPWKYIWAAWEDPSDEMPERFTFSPSNPHVEFPLPGIFDLVNILKSSDSNFTKQNLSAQWFSSLIHTLLESYGRKNVEGLQKSDSSADNYGKLMKRFIHENFSSRINASDVADFINLERSYASRIFKSCFDIGIYSYISRIRFQKACDLLKGDYSVKEVCFTCGYSDYGNFLRSFKKTSGFSPTEFRNKETAKKR